MKRVSVLLREADKQAAKTICNRYGLATRSDAIRFALRVLANSKRLTISDMIDGTREHNDAPISWGCTKGAEGSWE